MGYSPGRDYFRATNARDAMPATPSYVNPHARPGVYGGHSNVVTAPSATIPADLYTNANPLVRQLVASLQQSPPTPSAMGPNGQPYQPTPGGGIQRIIPGPDPTGPKVGAGDFFTGQRPYKPPTISIPQTPQGPSTAMYRPGSQPYAMNSRPYMGFGGPAGAGGYYA
jgi:hypothetical protein